MATSRAGGARGGHGGARDIDAGRGGQRHRWRGGCRDLAFAAQEHVRQCRCQHPDTGALAVDGGVEPGHARRVQRIARRPLGQGGAGRQRMTTQDRYRAVEGGHQLRLLLRLFEHACQGVQLLDIGMGDRRQARQLGRTRVLRVHAAAAQRLQDAVLARVVGHDGQLPVAAEHAVERFQVAHRGAGGIDRRQPAVIAALHRYPVIARGGGDELPQPGRAAGIARARAVAAFHEGNQRELGGQAGRAQFVHHITEQWQGVILDIAQP